MTSLPTTECPQCESPQKFPVRLREFKPGVWHEYIRCTLCGYEQVLPGITTPEIERVKRQVLRMAYKAEDERRHHGAMSGSTSKALRNLRKRRVSLQEELYVRERQEASGTASTD